MSLASWLLAADEFEKTNKLAREYIANSHFLALFLNKAPPFELGAIRSTSKTGWKGLGIKKKGGDESVFGLINTTYYYLQSCSFKLNQSSIIFIVFLWENDKEERKYHYKR